jgi:hypothetical protein
MKYLLFAKLLLLSTTLLAQTGNFFLSHYAPVTERFDNVCFDMVQDVRGMLYFATNDGIQQFDGKEWELLSAKGAIYSVTIDKSGDIYWSGSAGYGKIVPDANGKDSLLVLSTNVADVFQSVAVEEQIYFVNDQFVFVTTPGAPAATTIESTTLGGSFTGVFDLYGEAYVTTESGNIFKLDNNNLTQTAFSLPEGVDILTTAKLNDDYVILASNNRIYACDQSLALKEIVLQDQPYADASVIVNVAWVNSQLIALGTLRGGVIFANPISGKTQEIANYSTGLPDNEVFAMLSDNNQSIWVAHDYGFTRIAPYLPFRSFSHYPGIQGNLLCALSYRNGVYVGTSLGLFKLVKEDIYDELISYVDVEIKQNPKPVKGKTTPVVVEKPAIEKQAEPESKKRRFFSFLRRKKDEKPEENKTATEKPASEKPAEVKKEDDAKPKYRREKKVERILRSSQYAYQRVTGIDAKVTQLIEFEGRLIAAGLSGVYEVSELASRVVMNEPVRFVFAYDNQSLLLASTYEDELRALEQVNGVWQPSPIFKDLDDQINYIFKGKENELWLNALDKVYRLEIDSQKVKNIQTLSIANANLDETVGISWRDKIIFTNANGFYQFHRQTNEIVRMDTLPRPRTYFATGGNLWYRDSHRWNILGTLSEQSNLQLLNLFNDLRFVSSDQTPDNLWLVTRKNELYKFYGEKITPYERGYPVYLKSIVSGEKRVRFSNDIEIGENDGVLLFGVVQPDYTGVEAIEYRFMLNGLNQEWSDWSSENNSFDFPYLPPGRYSLQVQSRNIFGKVADMKAVSFQVLPPYWQRSWFYALEFFLFAGLVILSYRLSTRYRFISRLLMLITIILLIEFIQTVAGATFASKESPVMDFFIQVGVALVILPIESYLRNLMLRSIGSPEIPPILRTKSLKGEGKS